MLTTARQDILVATGILWDPSPIITVQQTFGPDWLLFFQVITLLGTVPAALMAVALAFWLAGRQFAYGLFMVVLLGATIGAVLKTVVSLPRPHDLQIIVRTEEVAPSFPSGHALTAITLWGVMAARHFVPMIVPFLIVPLVMLSRMYLGVHYLGDVLVGALIGLALVVLSQRLWVPVRDWLAFHSFRFFVIAGSLISVALLASLLEFRTSFEDWQTIGAGCGGVVGFLLEYRYLRYSPPVSYSPIRTALLVGLGLGVLVLPLVVVWLLDGSPPMQAVSYALAAFWITLGAPALFIRLGQSQRVASRR